MVRPVHDAPRKRPAQRGVRKLATDPRDPPANLGGDRREQALDNLGTSIVFASRTSFCRIRTASSGDDDAHRSSTSDMLQNTRPQGAIPTPEVVARGRRFRPYAALGRNKGTQVNRTCKPRELSSVGGFAGHLRDEPQVAITETRPRRRMNFCAIPMSANLRAGASFTPSPVTATTSPPTRRAATIGSLRSGARRGYTETNRTWRGGRRARPWP